MLFQDEPNEYNTKCNKFKFVDDERNMYKIIKKANNGWEVHRSLENDIISLVKYSTNLSTPHYLQYNFICYQTSSA